MLTLTMALLFVAMFALVSESWAGPETTHRHRWMCADWGPWTDTERKRYNAAWFVVRSALLAALFTAVVYGLFSIGPIQ